MANHFSIHALKTPWTVWKVYKTLKDELPRLVGAQYATGDQWRNNTRKNEKMEPKQKQNSVVDVTGEGSKVWCCKEQYCIGSWNIRSISSVQFSRSVMSDSLWPHESQHTMPPCPSPIPGVYSDPCPSSWWCHPIISSSVVPFSSCPQSVPASRSFPMSQLFAWGGQSTGLSASASVLPMNTQDWSPSGWTVWISMQYKGLSRVFSNTTVKKHQFFSAQLSIKANWKWSNRRWQEWVSTF